MRRFDKKNNIKKANLLAEERYLSTKVINEGEFDMGELGREARGAEYGINPYQEQPDLTPQEGDTYTNVNVMTQDGTVQRNVKVVSVDPEERKALVRTDSGGEAIVSFDDLN